MQLRVRLFGITKDIIGKTNLELEAPLTTRVQDLLETLQTAYPDLAKLPSVLIAVNDEYANADVVLHPNDEIALIPPVSGG